MEVWGSIHKVWLYSHTENGYDCPKFFFCLETLSNKCWKHQNFSIIWHKDKAETKTHKKGVFIIIVSSCEYSLKVDLYIFCSLFAKGRSRADAVHGSLALKSIHLLVKTWMLQQKRPLHDDLCHMCVIYHIMVHATYTEKGENLCQTRSGLGQCKMMVICMQTVT